MVHIIFHCDDAEATTVYVTNAPTKEKAVEKIKQSIEKHEETPMSQEEFFETFTNGNVDSCKFGDNGWEYEIISDLLHSSD